MDWDTAYRTLRRSAGDARQEFLAPTAPDAAPLPEDHIPVSDEARIDAARAIGLAAPFAPADLHENDATALRFASITEGAILWDMSEEILGEGPAPDPARRAEVRRFIEARLKKGGLAEQLHG